MESLFFKAYYQTPIGFAEIIGTAEAVTAVRVLEQPDIASADLPDCITECIEQLDQYFKGARTEFSLKLAPQGTDFQQKVWGQLLNIPFGQTVSYLDIAVALGDKKAVRAVGSANGKNKIWIIVPCHRVVGSDGTLTGYAGGVWRKDWLLKHEQAKNVRYIAPRLFD